MRILCVSGYAAWDKVSQKKMPSHHLFGINEIIDHYIERNGAPIRGVISTNVFPEGGYVDFYIWKFGKKNVAFQVFQLLQFSKNYDLIYDQLNRCSIYLGLFKRLGILKCKLLTIMHHPPYNLQLKVSDSDGYIFFNDDYKKLAEVVCHKKESKYYVNEWYPDSQWYEQIKDDGTFVTDAFFIDNGKSKRDRKSLVSAADSLEIRVDYAGAENEEQGYARAYCIDLKDDIGMVKRLKKYHTILIPILKNDKYKIGPLGITSFLDCVALGIPVIASDNVCFAEEIIKYNLGIIYETENVESLKNALRKLKTDEIYYANCKKGMEKYRNNKTIKDYSINLVKIICSLIKTKYD